MKEIKAFIRAWKVQEIIPELKRAGFHNVTFSMCEGTGRHEDKEASPSLRFHITDTEIAKLELVCANSDVDKIIRIISDLGRTHESGDGIIYVYPVDKAVKVKNGEDAGTDFNIDKTGD